MNHRTEGLIGAVGLNEFNEEIKRISRYFLVVSEKFQGKKLGKLLRNVSSDYTEEIIKDKGYTHTYIESTNKRSYNLQIASNLKIVGTLNIITMLFLKKKYNFNLKGEFSLIGIEEWKDFHKNLKEYYKEYKMLDDEISMKPDSYYVQRDENGEIILGAYTSKSEMELVNIPGFLGKFVNFMSFLPFVEKLIKNFQSVVISGIYCKEGNEKELSTFLGKIYETLGFGSNMLIFLDEKSPLVKYVEIKGAVFTEKSEKIFCFMKSKNLTKEEELKIEKKLIFPSPLEVQ